MKSRVVIIGGGFGGIKAAKVLGRSNDVAVTLLDRKNHHLFQPLLYQVATAALNPSDIGVPIRLIVADCLNTRVHMENVLSIDLIGKQVITDSDKHSFDYLIMACGSSHSYFGHDEWEELAPGLKTIEHALEIRRRILLAFEKAEKESDPTKQAKLLTFVVVGGGPTGVELAGSVAELANSIVSKEFRNIQPNMTRIILIQGGERLLPSFASSLSEKAKVVLESKGVEVMLKQRANSISKEGITVGGTLIATDTIMWAAGVRPSPLNKFLGAPLDQEGRVIVRPDLSVPGHDHIFVVGDQAHFDSPSGPLPGLAPVAMQQGIVAAQNILREIAGKSRKSFRFINKGTMAVIGRANAVVELPFGNSPLARMSGFPAWVIWIFVHIMYLVGYRNRIIVLLTWAWSYFTFKRGARMITQRVWKNSDVPD